MSGDLSPSPTSCRRLCQLEEPAPGHTLSGFWVSLRMWTPQSLGVVCASSQYISLYFNEISCI